MKRNHKKAGKKLSKWVVALRKSPRLELCLCGRCAGVFYDDKGHYIRRKDMNQAVFEDCDICSRRPAYDFLVWNREDILKNLK